MPTPNTAEQTANLCHNIAYLRRKHGLTQKEMALTLGIGVKSLSSIERGSIPKNLSVLHLYFLAWLFGVSVRSLLVSRMGDDEAQPS